MRSLVGERSSQSTQTGVGKFVQSFDIYLETIQETLDEVVYLKGQSLQSITSMPDLIAVWPLVLGRRMAEMVQTSYQAKAPQTPGVGLAPSLA